MDKRGTMGRLTGPNIVEPIWTLERPWKDNQQSVSCIPAGTYLCTPHGWELGSKNHFTKVWEVKGVKDRQAILIHAGNTINDTEGCILVGYDVGQFRVDRSRIALNALRTIIGERPFALTIQEAPNARRL